MTTIEIFKRMLDWLYDNQLASNQTEVARKTGIHPTHMSKIHIGKIKSVKQETLRAVNAAYGNPFNPEWLRGESDVMLADDLALDGASVGVDAHGQPSVPIPTDLTAQLLAAKDESIAALKREQAAKDATIAAKDDLIASLQQQIADLCNLKKF